MAFGSSDAALKFRAEYEDAGFNDPAFRQVMLDLSVIEFATSPQTFLLDFDEELSSERVCGIANAVRDLSGDFTMTFLSTRG